MVLGFPKHRFCEKISWLCQKLELQQHYLVFRGYFTKILRGQTGKNFIFLSNRQFFYFVAAVDYLLTLDNLTECGLMTLRKHKTIFWSFFFQFLGIFFINFYLN